jgi:hypothetical protein
MPKYLRYAAFLTILILPPAFAAEGDPGSGTTGAASPASQLAAPKQGAPDADAKTTAAPADANSDETAKTKAGQTK